MITETLEVDTRDRARKLEASVREGALARLKAGQVLDLLGRRVEALGRYREVLALEDVAGAHREAERCIDRPYRDSRFGAEGGHRNGN